MFRVHKYFSNLVVAGCLFLSIAPPLFAQQLAGTETKYIRVGSLQSKFTSIGAERAWNNVYYEGLTWPSDYPYTDNAVIERTWIGCENFADASGHNWDYYCVPINGAYANTNAFPTELKETAKFANPTVYVDGVDVSAPYSQDVDEIDPNQIADRIVTNVVNTTMGITMTRRVLAFSQQYHDNYLILEYTFRNTGFVNSTNQKVLNATVKGFRFGFMNRYSVSRDGAFNIGGSQTWGKYSWTTRRGEDYVQHASEISNLTEASPIPTWLRAGFEWAGQSDVNSYDNTGGPSLTTGRLAAPQFCGIVTLHVDKSTTDRSDDPNQPPVNGWHAGDTYPGLGDMTPSTAPQQKDCYKLLSGIPYGAGMGNDTERFYEDYNKPNLKSPYLVHNDGGGTGMWMAYGPWDINPGDSINLVIAVGVSGLDRQACIQIGKRWKQAYDNSSDKGPFTLPNGSTTTDKDVYKDAWVLTGMDSIMKTYGRAVRNYGSGYTIPEPPQPPPLFSVTSGGDRISLTWDKSPSEGAAGFAGYKIFRAVGTPDTIFDEIATLPAGTTSYDDVTPQRGFSYYYYISAFSDGSNNTSGVTNPTGRLLSSRFYTKTDLPAHLERQPGPLPKPATGTIPVSTILNPNTNPDTINVLFQVNPRFAGQTVFVGVTDFSITVEDSTGNIKTTAPPLGTLPLHLSTVPGALMLLIDSATASQARHVSYSLKVDNAKSQDMVQITVNGYGINLPDSIVSPYSTKKWTDAIRIVPNPYNIRAAGLQFPGEPDKIEFFNIPGHCTIRIYTENGDLIKTIYHENGSGDEAWNSNTSSNQVVVSGVYIVHFTVTQDYTDPATGQMVYRKGDTAFQKFIVIR